MELGTVHGWRFFYTKNGIWGTIGGGLTQLRERNSFSCIFLLLRALRIYLDFFSFYYLNLTRNRLVYKLSWLTSKLSVHSGSAAPAARRRLVCGGPLLEAVRSGGEGRSRRVASLEGAVGALCGGCRGGLLQTADHRRRSAIYFLLIFFFLSVLIIVFW